MKLKYTRYQSTNDILLKIKFDSHLWPQCIQAYATIYQDFHKTRSSREKDAMPLQSMKMGHPSKLGKLNGVGKIFLDLFDLHKYTLITTIHFMVDDVEASQSLQSNVFKKFGVPYRLFMKLMCKDSIDCFLQTIKKRIIEHDEDEHDRVIYQNALGIFSFSLFYSKKVNISLNIYISSLSSVQFQVKYFFKIIDNREELHVYASENLLSQINNLVSNQDKVRKTKIKHAQKLWLDPYKET